MIAKRLTLIHRSSSVEGTPRQGDQNHVQTYVKPSGAFTMGFHLYASDPLVLGQLIPVRMLRVELNSTEARARAN